MSFWPLGKLVLGVQSRVSSRSSPHSRPVLRDIDSLYHCVGVRRRSIPRGAKGVEKRPPSVAPTLRGRHETREHTPAAKLRRRYLNVIKSSREPERAPCACRNST